MTLKDVEKLLRQRPEGWWDVLVKVIPELEPLTTTEQSLEHHSEGDVATHTRLAIAACDNNCEPDLLWAALLHDIGKPETTINREGRVTAHKHEKVGSEIA